MIRSSDENGLDWWNLIGAAVILLAGIGFFWLLDWSHR